MGRSLLLYSDIPGYDDLDAFVSSDSVLAFVPMSSGIKFLAAVFLQSSAAVAKS